MSTIPLEPDADLIGAFVGALFPYADPDSYVSIRAFDQSSKDGPARYNFGSKVNGAGLDSIIVDAMNGARFAANYTNPLVLCSPIATFQCAKKATETDLVNGFCITVELDKGNTTEKQRFLEELLGRPATCVVKSGGEWIDPDTGEIFPKLHLHWRLSEPTRNPGEHATLKYARRLACGLVKADPSAISIVHPLRWPGSWHMKGTPKLAGLVVRNTEVHLHEAVQVLEDAVEAAGLKDHQGSANPQPWCTPHAAASLIHSAMAALPNADEHWNEWNRIGMAAYSASAGSDDGLEAWATWSAKSTKHVAGECDTRWAHFHTSPPTRIGFGTIAFHAKAAGWEPPAPVEVGIGPIPHAPRGDQAADAPGATATVQLPVFFDPWAELQPPPFPIDALPPVLKDFAEDRARIIGADPCGVSWAAMSAASAALNGSIRLRMKRHDLWSVPPAIWVALIGRPSSKKTPMIDAAWDPLMRAQKIDLDQWKQQVADWKSLPKKERDEDEPHPKRRLVSTDATMEALQEILSRQDRGIGVKRDELSGWLGSLEKYSGAKAASADRAFFLQAFDGGHGVVDRVSRGCNITINNLLVAICGGIQPERLKQFSDLTDDGLWQRFVSIILAPPTRGLDSAPTQNVANYEAAIRGLLAVPGGTVVSLSDAAHEIRADVERRIFDLEQNDSLGARFSSFCGKLVGLWGRLCLVLNYLDPGDVPFIVPVGTAKRASVLLFESVIPNAARVYAATGGAGADIEATRSIAGFILTKTKYRILASEVSHNIRACRGEPLDQIQRLVSPLVAGGWLTPEKDYSPSLWTVHPDVHVVFAQRRETETARRKAIRAIITGKGGDDAER